MPLSDRLNPSIPLASRNVGGLGAALEAGREDKRRNQLFELAKEDRTRQQGFEDQDRAAAEQAAQAQQNLESIAVGAVEVKPLLDNIESIPRAVNVLTRRIQEIEARQGDASDTKEVLEMVQAGRIDQARAAVDSAIKAAEAQGIIKRPGGDVTDPSAVREFQFFQGLSPEKQEQFIKVKRASGQIVDIAGVPNIVNRETGTTTPLSTITKEVGAETTRVAEVEISKQNAAIQAKAITDLPKIENQTQTNFDLLDKLQNHPGMSGAVGLKGAALLFGARDDPLPGTPEADFKALVDQISGSVFLEAFQALKGGGHITEIEGEKAEQAIARIKDTNQSEAGYNEAINDLRTVMQTGLERQRNAAKGDFSGGGVVIDYNDLP